MNRKMTTCKFCGAEIAASAKTCPHCGGKNKKPVYKKWWFWVLVVLVLASLGQSGKGGKKSETSAKTAAEAAPTVTPKAAATPKPTEKPTAAPTAEPLPQREEINGFDETTNQTIEIGGVNFRIPDYLTKAEDGSDGSVNYSFSDGMNALNLNIKSYDAKAEQFIAGKDRIQNNMLNNSENAKLIKSQDGMIGSMMARTFAAVFGENSDLLGKVLLLYNSDSGKLIQMKAIEGIKAPKTFSSDTDRIFASAKKITSNVTAAENTDTEAGGKQAEESSDSVTPEFKKTMDEYEAFFNEYAEFMKKYYNSSDAMAMLNNYLSMLTRYTEAMEGLDKIDETKLSAADYAYYTEVMLRINAKLLEAANAMQ